MIKKNVMQLCIFMFFLMIITPCMSAMQTQDNIKTMSNYFGIVIECKKNRIIDLGDNPFNDDHILPEDIDPVITFKNKDAGEEIIFNDDSSHNRGYIKYYFLYADDDFPLGDYEVSCHISVIGPYKVINNDIKYDFSFQDGCDDQYAFYNFEVKRSFRKDIRTSLLSIIIDRLPLFEQLIKL